MMATRCQGGKPVYGDVDRGWAWIILIAMTFWNALIAGTLKSFGVIYLEFLERYQRGPVLTSWLGFSFSFLSTIFAPISGYIGDYVSLESQRVILMISSVLTTIFVAVTGSMSHLEGAIVTYGLAGIAVAIIDTPMLSLIGKYFKERRFLASAVVFAGSSFGTLVLPPLILFLVQQYNIQGAMLLFGGVWLNSCLASAVIRPLPPLDGCGSDQEHGETSQGENANGVRKINKDVKEVVLHEKHNVKPEVLEFTRETNQEMEHAKSLVHLPSSSNSFTNIWPHNFEQSAVEYRSWKSVPSLSQTFARELNLNYASSQQDCILLQQTASFVESSDHCQNTMPAGTLGRRLVYILQGYWRFLKSPGLPLLNVTFFLSAFAYFSHLFLFPLLAQEVHMTKMEGAFLVSLCNITELVSRLVVGILVDKKCVSKSLVVKVNVVLSAISCFLVSFFVTRIVLFLYSVFFGMIGGMFVPLCIPLMMELVDKSKVSSAAGLYVVVAGTGVSIGPPVLGAVKELSGSFVNSLRMCSVVYLLAFLVFLCQNGDISKCLHCPNKHTTEEQIEGDTKTKI